MRRRGTVREKTGYRELPGRCEAESEAFDSPRSSMLKERAEQWENETLSADILR